MPDRLPQSAPVPARAGTSRRTISGLAVTAAAATGAGMTAQAATGITSTGMAVVDFLARTAMHSAYSVAIVSSATLALAAASWRWPHPPSPAPNNSEDST
ncbi:hypothetical protein [Streptomyces sp. NPDC091416]|uniref:hypothetical protein n=1 Tax=Streptomyces sp. NPDC091416 TaxID=3366003 RepID=UPI0037FDD4BF